MSPILLLGFGGVEYSVEILSPASDPCPLRIVPRIISCPIFAAFTSVRTQAVFPNLESRLDVRLIGTPLTHQVTAID